MSYDVAVVVRPNSEESFIPGVRLWECTISLDGRSMTAKFALHGNDKPSGDDALAIIGLEANLADAYNTPELFERVFSSTYMEPELLMHTFEDMQDRAQQLKYVLGPVLYEFYTSYDDSQTIH